MDEVIVLDFGGQYCHLISRRIRELGVYCEVLPSDTSAGELRNRDGLKGVILSGGAASVYDDESPQCSEGLFELELPMLGICYGHQLIAHHTGGKVKSGDAGEYGLTELTIKDSGKLLEGLKKKTRVWMNHKDIVEKLPEGYSVLASTDHSPVAAYANDKRKIYGVQFHPEVTHTEDGMKVLENFIALCGASRDWSMADFIDKSVVEAKEVIGDRKAIIGLSGGVDSSTAAVLVSKALGDRLTAVYVDTGLMRYRETEFMDETFSGKEMNFIIVDAADRFFKALEGVTDPELKRKVIGGTFIEVFEEEAEKVGAEVLIQGTIYSDRIESGVTKHSDNIKSHHNVGGLPEEMKLDVYEPLRDLYKDEVREIARQLKLPEEIITRHVFPGPGLGIRVLGEVTPEKADICRRAGYIVEEELKRAGVYEEYWMGFAVLLPVKSVGIQGDSRSYKYPVVVRVIESKDAMTANFSKVPYELLEAISTRITNEIAEVNRVVYDITNKPPATMEWE
ncbi:MAG: glutamine-hydrolyzing GMP synthase [Candidatus Altiarchaeales archaeon]|nr:glutamine-hydrolyzing GMP synthase [Candidatus Altiarchaeales archaeon]MBD3416117.1 glutamine-hydrolyzing GMP synthase [Candidatus Altiarchaeales archaeon]